MKDIILSYDEMVSLRSFLIATVFDFFCAIEMETIGDYKVIDILSTATSVDSMIRFDVKDYKNPFRIKIMMLYGTVFFMGNLG